RTQGTEVKTGSLYFLAIELTRREHDVVPARLQSKREPHHWVQITERAQRREHDSPLAAHWSEHERPMNIQRASVRPVIIAQPAQLVRRRGIYHHAALRRPPQKSVNFTPARTFGLIEQLMSSFIDAVA